MGRPTSFPGVGPLFITSMSPRYTAGYALRSFGQAGTPASTAWIAANRALYFPFAIREPYKIRRLWWMNGATVNGTTDMGLYDADSGVQLISAGNPTQAGTDQPQYVSVSLDLEPGEYYLAMSSSSGTATFHRLASSTTAMRVCGCLQQATANPLPATMTGVAVSAAYWPLFGITSTSTGF